MAESKEHFRDTEDYSNMSAFERSLLDNRRQREYLLHEYRREGRIDDDQYMRAHETKYDRKKRKRRRKMAREA